MPSEKVQVWICFKEGGHPSFLLLKTNEERGSFWQPVTGSVESGEKVLTAATREMQEETGLQALNLHAVSGPFEFSGKYGPVREYPFLAEVAATDRTRVRLDPKEHVTHQWCSAESALELLRYESNVRVLSEIMKMRA